MDGFEKTVKEYKRYYQAKERLEDLIDSCENHLRSRAINIAKEIYTINPDPKVPIKLLRCVEFDGNTVSIGYSHSYYGDDFESVVSFHIDTLADETWREKTLKQKQEREEKEAEAKKLKKAEAEQLEAERLAKKEREDRETYERLKAKYND